MTFASASLDDLFEIARGGSPRPIDQYITDDDDGVNWIMISDASASSKYIERTKRRIKPAGVSKSRRVKPGDFLLTNSMSFGRPYILRTDGCIHDGWLVLSPKRNDVDPDYFYHLLGSDVLYAEFSRRAAGATVKNLNIDLVKGVEVTYPPIAEQKRIAAILDAADALRAKRRAALAKLDTLAQSIFIEMFGNPIKNPKEWEVRSLNDLIPNDRPLTYGILMPGENTVGGVLYVRVVDMKDGGIELHGIRRTTPEISTQYKRSLLKEGDLLISIRGHVGRTAIVPRELTGANITQDTARIASEVCDIEFLQATLRHHSVQDWMAKRTKGAAVKGINLGDLRTLPVICPPMKQQQTFATITRRLRTEQEAMKTQATSANALFASLQHRAFRGELTATDQTEIAA